MTTTTRHHLTPEERRAVNRCVRMLEANRKKQGRPAPGAPHTQRRRGGGPGIGYRSESPADALDELLPEVGFWRRMRLHRLAWSRYEEMANGGGE